MLQNHFFKVSNNVLWKFVTKKEERPDDEEKLKKIHTYMLQCVDGMSFTTVKSILQMNILFFPRILQYFGLDNFLDANIKVRKYLLEELDQSEPNEQGNYIEKALSERDSDIKEGKNSVFASVDGKLYILAQIFDLLFGGTETTAGSMEWMMYYLAQYPEYQEKMYKEIRALTGDNKRPVYLTDKAEAHYCCAFFDEVVRHSYFMSMIPGHITLQDEEIDGFKLPTGTQVR